VISSAIIDRRGQTTRKIKSAGHPSSLVECTWQ